MSTLSNNTSRVSKAKPALFFSVIALVVLAGACAALVVAMIVGFVTTVVAHLTFLPITVAHIQGFAGALSLLFAVTLAPVVLHAAFSLSTHPESLRPWFQTAKSSCKHYYLSLLAYVALCTVLGFIISVVFDRFIVHTLVAWIVECALLLVLGAVFLYLIYRLYIPKKHGISYGGPRRRNTPKKGPLSSLVRPKIQTHSCAPHAPNIPFEYPEQNNTVSPMPSPSRTQNSQTYLNKPLSPLSKIARTTLATLVFLGSVPSIWLYFLSDTSPAWALESTETNSDTGAATDTDTPQEQNTTNQDAQGQTSKGAQDTSFTPIQKTDPQNIDNSLAPTPVPKAPLKAPQIDPEPKKPEGALYEVSHDRFSRTYLNFDGTYTTRIQNEPLTYSDDSGKERDIDNTLISTASGFTNKANAYSVTLPKEGSGLTIEKDGYTLMSTPLFATLKDAVAKENAVLYNNASEGIDISYSVYGNEVKEDVILKAPSTLTSFDYVLFAPDMTLILKDNTVFAFDTKDEEQQIAQALFTLSAPLMKDASGEVSSAITLELEGHGPDATLRLAPDFEWLSSPERAYPVTIDPAHALGEGNLTQGTIQAFEGDSSGPDVEHNISYLIVGLENGDLVGVPPIVYGESWAYVKINDITPYTQGLPERAILSAKLWTYEYGYLPGAAGWGIDAKMIADDWAGSGRHTWNNRPVGGGLTYLDRQTIPYGTGWMAFDITDAFKAWKQNPYTNKGIMLTPESEAQPAVAFSGTGNAHGQEDLYFDLSWTVPRPVDENYPLGAPNVNVRPLTYKNSFGVQNVVGLFADGTVRPALKVDYTLHEYQATSYTVKDTGTYPKAEYEPDYPNSDLFLGQLSFTLGFRELYQSNWQSKLILGSALKQDTVYRMSAQGTRVYDVWANPDDIFEQTPWGLSDSFIVYEFKEQDTLPYVAAYYGVNRNTIALDNRVGDDLAMVANTLFIRNPNANATIPYTRPAELTLEHKRALIYANMGRSQVSEFDMEPVNMATGNFYLEHTDATSSEYGSTFALTRSYNSLAPQASGPFGRGFATEFNQVIVATQDGSITYTAPDGRRLVFEKTDTGWASPTGYNFTLEKHDNTDPHAVIYTITKPDSTLLTFDSYGVLSCITDTKGLKTRISYDENYRMDAIIAASGRVYDVETDNAGHVTSITLPNGAHVFYGYDEAGYLTQVTDADGATVAYEYDERGQMSAWTDGTGAHVVQNSYDDEGRIVAQTDARGNTSYVGYTDTTTTLTDALGIDTTYTYNSLYQVVKKERAGTSHAKSYDVSGHLLSETDEMGRTTTYAYDAAGNLVRLTRADGTYQEMAYNERALPTSVRDFDGAVTVQDFDAEGNLTRREFADGTLLSYTYDSFGRMTSLTDEVGATTTFSYQGNTSMTTTDALGNTTSCYYDAMGRLVSEVDATAHEMRTMYTPAGKVSSTWETGGATTHYSYDEAGRCIAITDALGYSTTYTYDAFGNMLSSFGPEGSILTWTYDALGNKTSETDAKGNTTSFSYDAAGNLTATKDALGGVTSNTYDASGRLTSTTNAQGALTTYTYRHISDKPTEVSAPARRTLTSYDAAGRVLEEVRPDNTSHTFTYDARGRMLTDTDQAGFTVSYVYDAAGRTVSTQDSLGRNESATYDIVGNLIYTTDALGQMSAYTYDAAGRVLFVTEPKNRTTALSYDEAGNIASLTLADNTTLHFSYDAKRNLIQKTDALGTTTRYTYSARGDVATQTDALGHTTYYIYDENQLLCAITDALGHSTTYDYDALNRLASITDALGASSYLSYDEVGNLTLLEQPEGVYIATEYDTSARPLKTEDATGLITEYVYDAQGHLIYTFDSDGYDARSTYDSYGRVVSETDALGRVATYTYDPAGNLTHTKDFNGDETTLTYDVLDRVVRKQTSTGEDTTYTYDPLGKIATEECFQKAADTQSNTNAKTPSTLVRRAYTYDKAGELIAYTEEIDGKTSKTHYSYDIRGNRVSKTTGEEGTCAVVSTYDESGRLTKQTDTSTGTVTSYTYDADGNLISKLESANAQDDTSSTSGALGALFVNDGAGAVFQDATLTTYTYDAESRLRAVREGGALLQAATYDGDGNRVFQVHRTTVPAGLSLPVLSVQDTEGSPKDVSPLDVLSFITTMFSPYTNTTPNTYSYLDKVYPNEFLDVAFYYGFGEALTTFLCLPDMACAPLAQKSFTRAFNTYVSEHGLEHRYDTTGEFSDGDIAALYASGLSQADVYDVTHPKDAPKTPEDTTLPLEVDQDSGLLDKHTPLPDKDPAPVIIPAVPTQTQRYDYELTYYVNDISYTHTQVAQEYGKRSELTSSYTYGKERIMSLESTGDVSTYLYDGKGSVAQLHTTKDVLDKADNTSSFPDHVIAPDIKDILKLGSLVTTTQDILSYAGSLTLSPTNTTQPSEAKTTLQDTPSLSTPQTLKAPLDKTQGTITQNYTYDPWGSPLSPLDENK
ncbi:MAG: DUF6531 domain-containing protein, partial [Coriobacteriales bacterium]|nr:DUF6531 domain-containing protein [Coriobacteriales bacterium]